MMAMEQIGYKVVKEEMVDSDDDVITCDVGRDVSTEVSQYPSKPHFLSVYWRNNPRGMLGEHEKTL